MDKIHSQKGKSQLDKMLIREKRVSLANACFNFIQYKTKLDVLGWNQTDIFNH